MGSVFIKLLFMAMGAGVVAGNTDKIEAFYQELKAQTLTIVSGMDMRGITMMLDYHYISKGRYPKEAGFEQWMRENFKENDFRSLSEDAWGNPFIYTTGEDRKTFKLLSAGPDGETGTEDDIVSTGP